MSIIVYDLETTGLLRPGKDELPGIIQIGAIKYDWKGKELAVFETRVNPELPPLVWEEGAIKTTGIGPDDVGKDWPTFFEIFPQWADFVAGTIAFSGYNILGYDDDVLFNNLVRYGFEKHFPWPRLRLDVMNIAKAHHNQKGKRGNKRPKLGEIYKELFGEELEGAHDAMNDVRGTGRVLFEIGGKDIERIAA